MSMVFNGDWVYGDVKSVNKALNQREIKTPRDIKCPSCSHVNEVDDLDIDVTWYVMLSPAVLRLP